MIELHPQLQERLVTVRDMRMIKHPLVVAFYFGEADHERLNNQLNAKESACGAARLERDWHQLVWLHERPFRFDALFSIKDLITDAVYWDLVKSVWIDSENIYENLRGWEVMLASDRPGREQMMTEDERAFVSDLPAKVRLYRGHQALNRNGLSYTLSVDKAKWFAKRFGPGDVRVRSVAKEDIVAYFNTRSEAEIVIHPRAR